MKFFDRSYIQFEVRNSDFINSSINYKIEGTTMQFIIDKEVIMNEDGVKIRRVYDDDNEHIGDFLVEENQIVFNTAALQEEVVEEAIEDAAEYGLKRFGLSALVSATQVAKFITDYVIKGFVIVFNLVKGLFIK